MAKTLQPQQFLSYNSSYHRVDVRTPEEWAEHHEKGALHMPLDELEMRIRELPKNKPLAVVCRSGGRGARACDVLVAAGFDVYNLSGGLKSLLAEKKKMGLIGEKEFCEANDAVG